MIGANHIWEKLGRILKPKADIYWMSSYTGSSFAVQVENTAIFDIYVSGRDERNRTQIGRVRLNIRNPHQLLEVDSDPVLTVGNIGAFDENGVSYPYIVNNNGRLFMFYTGWMPSVLTPFQNHLGLAVRNKLGRFERISRAPILPRNNDDYLSIGSVGVIQEGTIWRMWYTSFQEWGEERKQPKHKYKIKYAESRDGQNWHRENRVCIDFKCTDEHSICRPTVFRDENLYHMWYCYKGDHYRIGYASSRDGLEWKRQDELAGIQPSSSGWDSIEQCYPHVFRYEDCLYMF